jgi:glycosyltransferase involved in cell wall biosynthesis
VIAVSARDRMPPLTILHTAHTYAPNLDGVAQVVQHISEGLTKHGHAVHVAVPWAGEPAEEIIEGVHVHRFSVYGQSAARVRTERERYGQMLASGPWDVIAAHMAGSWSTEVVCEVSKFVKAKLVFVSHGLRYRQRPSARLFRQLGEALKNFAATTELSALLVEPEFYHSYSLPLPRIIPNGVHLAEIDTAVADMRSLWSIGSRPWVINVSNHSPVKGHAILHQLAHMLRDDHTVVTNIGNSYPADFRGLGRYGIRGGCYYACVVRNRLGSALQSRCGVARPQMLSALKQADVFAFTSRSEASPVVILEAMAAGVPWVSFDVGNIREHPGGFVVKDVAEMAATIRLLLQQPALRKATGQQGRTWIEQRHRWEQITLEYEQLYWEITNLR